MLQGVLQPSHLILILAVVLIVFGPGKLPELGSALGKGLRELKKGVHDPDGSPSEALPAEAAVHVAPTAGLTCSRCGATHGLDVGFCTACGARLTSAALDAIPAHYR